MDDDNVGVVLILDELLNGNDNDDCSVLDVLKSNQKHNLFFINFV